MGAFDHIHSENKAPEDVFAHIPDTVPPRMKPETPEESSLRKRQSMAFLLGAARGGSYNLADLIPGFKEKAEGAKAGAPEYFGYGENAGGVGSALFPIGPEAIGMKAIGPVAKGLGETATSALESLPFLKRILPTKMAGEVLSGATKVGAGAGAGQAVREIPEVLKTGDPTPSLERVKEASLSGARVGAIASPIIGLSGRTAENTKNNLFNETFPETKKDTANRTGEILAGKRLGLPAYADKEVPSYTQDIIDQGLTGGKHELTARAGQVISDSHEKVSKVMDRLDQKMSAQNDPGFQNRDLLAEFLGSKSAPNPRILSKRPDSYIDAYHKTVGRLLGLEPISEKDAANLGGEAIAGVGGRLYSTDSGSKFLRPSELNETKQAAYKIAGDSAYETSQDNTMAAEKKAYKDVSLFLKKKVEDVADSLGDRNEKALVRTENNRQAAMINYKNRINNSPQPSLKSYVKSAIIPAAAAASGAAYLTGESHSTLAPAIGAAAIGGFGNYFLHKPLPASTITKLIDRGQKAGAYLSPSLLRAMSALSEEKQ